MARFYGMRARYLATAALLLAAALAPVLEWAGGDDHEKAERPARSGERLNLEASPEATAAPGRQLELASRSLPSAGGNPFFTQAQVQPPSPPPRAATREPSAAPPAPQAPPLPFTYLGRIRSGETTTVFLARDNRESSARLGSILDDTYRVEKIDEDRLVLVYLPLGTQQTLLFAPESLMARAAQPGGSQAAAASGAQNASALQLDAPEQVSTGQDFTVNLSLRAGRTASVSLTFDPNVLSAVRRPAPGDTTLPDRGRVLIDVVGPGFAGAAPAPTAVRFRVVGAAPTTTQIQVEYLSTTHDSDLESLIPPAPRRIFVTAASAEAVAELKSP
jgi:hypothetical protein